MSSLSNAPDLLPPLPPLPGPVATLDFHTVGVTWVVRRRGGGPRQTFSTLQALRDAWQRGEVSDDDALSSDGTAWRFLGRIPDLEALFTEVWLDAQPDDDLTAPPEPLQDEEPTRIQRAPTLPTWTAPQPTPTHAVTPPTQWGWTAVAFSMGALAALPLLAVLLFR